MSCSADRNAKAKIKASTEAKKEAEAYAEKAQYVSTIISVVMIAVTLILTLLTFGAGAMLFVAVAMAIGAMMVIWALAPHLGHTSGRGWPTGVFVANALGLVGAGSLHLAFLSPAAWRRWIAERTAT